MGRVEHGDGGRMEAGEKEEIADVFDGKVFAEGEDEGGGVWEVTAV